MTPEEITLIQLNLEAVAPRAEEAATVFYNRLFAIQPALRLLFPEDISEQKKKLMMTLAIAVKSLRETEKLTSVLENLGRRHAVYGVRNEHYETVGAALLLMLEEMLGEEFTPAARTSWARLYDFVAAAMKSGALALEKECASEFFGDAFDAAFNEGKQLKNAGQIAV